MAPIHRLTVSKFTKVTNNGIIGTLCSHVINVQKAITDAEQNYPRNVISMSEKAESEQFSVNCAILGKPNEPIYVAYVSEPTGAGYLAKKRVFEHWLGDIAYGPWKGRTIRKTASNLNSVTIVISKLTLADTGYYFCEYLLQGVEGNKFSDLHQLTMWARPDPPQISGKPHYYADTVVQGGTEQLDFTLPQSILECRAEKAFPKPKLRWIDQTGKEMKTDGAECYGSKTRPDELFDCSMSLKVIVTKELDQRQFTCEMSHETLYGEVQSAQRQINVFYPPTEVTINGNRTTKEITCKGRSNPPPEFAIQVGQLGTKVPITNPKGIYYVADLASLNENDLVFCHATNGLEPAGENHG